MNIARQIRMSQSFEHRIVRQCRRAVTLVEVIFSIGVILIGLLGLMSILPLAGRRAQDSISLNTGSALSDSILDQLLSQRFLSTGRLRGLNNVDILLNPQGQLFSNQSFVIDPMFCSGYEDAATVPPSPSGDGYELTLFPFYAELCNPLRDPSVSGSATWTVNQPRLDRAGIRASFGTNVFIDREQSLRFVENHDDLPLDRSDDRSEGYGFTTLQATASGLLYGKRAPKGEFSWFATVNPLPGGVYASVAVVVMRNREREFDTLGFGGAVNSPEENELAERLAYVRYASGFSGGAGGVVHLAASKDVPSDIGAGDWVMLSRIVDNQGTNMTDDDEVFHRWYRVVAATEDPEELSITDPSDMSSRDVWQHKVLLDGADWSFGFVTPGNSDALVVPSPMNPFDAGNTYATIVKDVVSVSEKTVLLSDL